MKIRFNPKQMMRHSGVRGNSADDDKSATSESPLIPSESEQPDHLAAKL